jgi:hypothetical protein
MVDLIINFIQGKKLCPAGLMDISSQSIEIKMLK